MYNTLLHGPPPVNFTAAGQTLAAYIINPAVGFSRVLQTNATTMLVFSFFIFQISVFVEIESSSPTLPSSHSAHVKAIVGGVVGTFGALILAAIVFIIFHKRHREKVRERALQQLEFKPLPFVPGTGEPILRKFSYLQSRMRTLP